NFALSEPKAASHLRKIHYLSYDDKHCQVFQRSPDIKQNFREFITLRGADQRNWSTTHPADNSQNRGFPIPNVFW
ncbi:MAG: hypothetical protein ACQEQO_07455, partial [Thermodesulfobacteriota bacterium]